MEPEEKQEAVARDLFRKAYEYQVKGELDRAVEIYKKSIEAFPTAGEWTKALESYENSLKANPDYALAGRAINRLKGLFN